MDFGKVDSAELDKIDFTLPPDHPGTIQVLKKYKAKSTEVYIGCAKWGRPDWVGKIYPPKTKQADFLNHYAKHFNCIELNATFYRMPTKSQIKTWKDKVGPDFKFCPKFVDQITHIKRLKDTKELVDRFLEAIYEFRENLGPLFLMPHPQMGPKSLEVQQAFIESMPKDIQLFAEQRHKDWYGKSEAFDSLFAMMEKSKTGSIITDASGRRDCVHMRLSTPEVFIRFVGNGLHPTDYTRIDNWIQRMKSWMEQGIHKIYFFMHQHEELHSPELCRYMIPEINKHCGTAIPEIKFVA
ncbi:MAG: DUF72 domain-containing protein [Flammeovirgaceae bacterium]|nr:DUF72 domain-containing protein [Flammeovirgaceae bacterium]